MASIISMMEIFFLSKKKSIAINDNTNSGQKRSEGDEIYTQLWNFSNVQKDE